MGTATAVVSTALLDRLKSDREIARQISIIYESPWCDHTHFIGFEAPALGDGSHGHQDIILDGNSVRFKPDRDV